MKTGLNKAKLILGVLPAGDRRKLWAVLAIQAIMSLLDLVGIALIGILGALAVNGIQSKSPGDRVSTILRFLHLENYSFQSQAAVLALIAVVTLVSRTFFSIIFTRRTLFFLSRRAAALSGTLISKLLSQPLLKTRENSSQETLFAITTGVSTLVLGVIGVGITTLADLCLLFVLGAGLFIVDPLVAVGTYCLFVGVGIFLYKTMSTKAKSLGLKNSNLTIQSNQKILEVLQTYREAFIRNRRQYYATQIGRTRLEIAETLAEQQFMPNIGKYVIESSLLLGGFIISATQFVMQDATHAVATLSVFMAAGTRIAPAILRIQQGALSIKGGIASAGLTLDLLARLENVTSNAYEEVSPDFRHTGFSPLIEMNDIFVKYPENSFDTISNLSLKINPGEMIAIVGESGAGKTTLVDLLLGIIEPDLGTVLISGLAPNETIGIWPGAIGYVPQDSWLIDGTIAENIALGFPEPQKYEKQIHAAIETAQLKSFIQTLPEGVESLVGERGTKMSGGQRQRVGIARALFTSPKLLVLDEATSSLDSQTEQEITQSLQELKGVSTVVIIAHRLTTILSADRIIYLANGKVLADGTFDEVRAKVSEFDDQLKLNRL